MRLTGCQFSAGVGFLGNQSAAVDAHARALFLLPFGGFGWVIIKDFLFHKFDRSGFAD